MVRALAFGTLLLLGCNASELPAQVAPAVASRSDASASWLKGQLHLHSDASGDSRTPAADVARWYAERGYDFIVFTDHNRIAELPARDDMLVLAGVELTQNLPRCSPPPAPEHQCLLHVNALVVDEARTDRIASVPEPDSVDRVERFAYAMRVTETIGGIAQLNHPNFHYAADADQIAALVRRGLVLFEVANEAWDSDNDGDATHPSTAELWDRVLTGGGRLYGTATDDAHHYDDAAARRAAGEPVFVGDLGFVMVRADRSPAQIRDALRRGDFYATTGVLLEDVAFAEGVLEIRVAEGSRGPHTIELIGDGGAIVHVTKGSAAHFDTRGRGLTYVRAVVTDGEGRRAWVQPVFLDGRP